jgi:predicted deacylase
MDAPSQLAAAGVHGAAPGPHLLITAGVHGDEYEPMVAVRRLIGLLPETLRRGRVTLVPVVNEAAFARGQRTAEDGLDLARVCPGKRQGSITERTAAALAPLIEAADYYVDLHTGGTLYDILPLAGYMLHDDPRVLDAQRQMARRFGLPIVWGTSARLDGRSLSVARDAGVPAIYVEHGGGGGCRAAAVEALVAGCLNVAAGFDMLDRPPLRDRVEHFVEQPEDASGHLQIQHPAPCDGYFEPCAALGDRLQQGDPLGTICDPLGAARTTVTAEATGLLLFLRVAPPVRAGDGLGGLLPIEGSRRGA